MVRAKLQQTNDDKEILKNDLQRSQNRLTEQDEDIRNLNRQLQIQQHQSNDINEHLLIKDAEVRSFFNQSQFFNRLSHRECQLRIMQC